jgi:hypothetical protein
MASAAAATIRTATESAATITSRSRSRTLPRIFNACIRLSTAGERRLADTGSEETWHALESWAQATTRAQFPLATTFVDWVDHGRAVRFGYLLARSAEAPGGGSVSSA